MTERKLTKKSVEIFPATRSAVDDIVSRIRALISERGYGVGDSLPTERELCEAFGTSRNTVREAMRMLKAYGIVEVRTKVGATLIDTRMSSAFEMFSFNLMDISRDTFADIQRFRCLLEVSSVEQIFDLIHRTDTDALREINDGFLKKCSVDEACIPSTEESNPRSYSLTLDPVTRYSVNRLPDSEYELKPLEFHAKLSS